MKIRATFDQTPPTAERLQRCEKEMHHPDVSPAARNLALAHYIERLIDHGVITDYTEAARMLGVSQPRVTHLMSLLLLAPQIQERILIGGLCPTGKTLRQLGRCGDWSTQSRVSTETSVTVTPREIAT